MQDQILTWRESTADLLTNRICKLKENGTCKEWSIETYDLKVKETRDRLREANFVCKVDGKRHRICEDEASLCRNRREITKCRLWWCNYKLVTDKILVEDKHQYLRDVGARCFNEDRYNWIDL